MGMQLPDELRKGLEYIGVDWPASDEAVIKGWATNWRTAATKLRTEVTDLDGAVLALGRDNQGMGWTAFKLHADGEDSAGKVLADAATGCDKMAGACELTAAVVLTFKGIAIANLVTLVAAVAAAVAAAAASAGILSGVSAGAVVLARRVAFDAITTALSDAAAELLCEDAGGTGFGKAPAQPDPATSDGCHTHDGRLVVLGMPK